MTAVFLIQRDGYGKITIVQIPPAPLFFFLHHYIQYYLEHFNLSATKLSVSSMCIASSFCFVLLAKDVPTYPDLETHFEESLFLILDVSS
jgi:hypothetical protein